MLCRNYTEGHCNGFDPELCINRCRGKFGADDCATTLFYLLEQCKTERDTAKAELNRVSYQKEVLQTQIVNSQPAQQERPKIFYVCDRLACERCDPECIYTSDIRHAENFELNNDTIIERKTVDISDIGRELKKL